MDQVLKYIVRNEIRNNPDNIKNILLNCVDKSIYKKIELIENTKLFLKYLRNKNININPIIRDINELRRSEISVDIINEIYEKRLKTNNNKYQLGFNIFLVVDWLENVKNIKLSNEFKNKLKIIINETTDDDDLDDKYELINKIFKKYLKDDYDYFFEIAFVNSQNNTIYNYEKWKTPKFTIKPISGSYPEKIRREEYTLGGIIEEEDDEQKEENKGISEIQKRVQKSMNKTLKSDFNTLENYLNIINKGDGIRDFKELKDFWKYNVIPFLKDKKPRKINKQSIYIYAIWLVYNLDLKDIYNRLYTSNIIDENLKFDKDLKNKKSYVYKFYNSLFQSSLNIDQKYKSKFYKLDDFNEDVITNVIYYLENNKVPVFIIDKINKEIMELLKTQSKITNDIVNNVIYNVLKNYSLILKEYKIKITKKLISGLN